MSDYIKREDAVNAFRLWVLTTHGHRYTNKECAPVFASIPPADVVPKDFHDKTCEAMAKRHTEEIQRLMPKRGEWISLHNGKWKCSECGIEVLFYAKGNFCPNCGADMRKGADDDNPTIHAIAYLQKVGWLQEHDRALTEPSNSEKPNNCKDEARIITDGTYLYAYDKMLREWRPIQDISAHKQTERSNE